MGFAAGREEGPEVEVSFTEIIIKVEPHTIILPEGEHTAALEDIEINSERLQGLNRQFNLVSIERVFAKKPKEDAEEYPERDNRAPEDAEEPDLENIFLFKFPYLIPPEIIVKEYEKLKEVIYAEENKIFSIY